MSQTLLYLDDCINILDNQDSPFEDATQMAYAIENSQKIDEKLIVSMYRILGWVAIVEELDYDNFGRYENVVWAYDSNVDIHHFFRIS